MSKKKILFQDTSFRDGFQSVLGARVLTDDFIPAVEAAAAAGIDHFEAGGGARYQSLFLYCGESAFDMMDRVRKAAGPHAKLQTLARGINVVALSQQPRDMIELHARMFKKHGITHIRNFDALNDVRNLEYSGKCIQAAGLHHQVCVTLMALPPGCSGAHDADFYVGRVKQILEGDVPFDSICFKDASGTTAPQVVHETVKRTRDLVGKDVLLWHHTHDTCGNAVAQYRASIEADIDGICLCRPPVSGGTAQTDMLTMWHSLKHTDWFLELDYKKILEANEVFKECMKDYFIPPEATSISPEVIFSPMPGGALTANTMMMRDTGTLHLYPKVIEAMSECVAKGGFGTSVTPVSQFYFQQAYSNVTQGSWEKFADGYGNMVLGYFGRTPVPPDEEVVKKAEEKMGKPRFTGDPLEILEPGIPKAKKILEDNNLPVTDENIFIVGALATGGGNKGLEFLQGKAKVNVRKKEAEKPGARKQAPSAGPQPTPSGTGSYKVTVNGTAYQVQVEESTGAVTHVSPSPLPAASVAATNSSGAGSIEVAASVPGNVLKLTVRTGDKVRENDPLLILEAMKMETSIASPAEGTVASIEVSTGDTVQAGQLLMTLNP